MTWKMALPPHKNMADDLATEARNTVLSIVTAARGGNPTDMRLAATLTDDYDRKHGSIYPLFISAVGIIESILLTVADEVGIPPDKLFAGICLGLTVRQITDDKNQQEKDEPA